MQDAVIADLAVVVDRYLFDQIDISVRLALLAAISLIGLVFWYRNLVRARLIEDTPTSRTRSAAQGYVELIGHQFDAPGHTVKAPLTGTPCTWWRYKIEQHKFDITDPGRRKWVTLEQGISKSPILLKDDKGQMLVDPRGAEVVPTTKDLWFDNRESPPRPMKVLKLRRGRFRYTEERMCAGDSLYVSGDLYSPSSMHSSISYEDALNDLLDRWKHDQPGLLRRFDANGDGHIDSNEWDKARQAARDEISARLHPRARSDAIDIIRKPDDGKPFILASKPQTELASKYRMFARNNLLLFIVFGAITLWFFYLAFLRH